MLFTVVIVSPLTRIIGTPLIRAESKTTGTGGVPPVRIRHLVDVSRAASCISGRSPLTTTALPLLRAKYSGPGSTTIAPSIRLSTSSSDLSGELIISPSTHSASSPTVSASSILSSGNTPSISIPTLPDCPEISP